jgi:hypothetical protein
MRIATSEEIRGFPSRWVVVGILIAVFVSQQMKLLAARCEHSTPHLFGSHEQIFGAVEHGPGRGQSD